LTQQLSHHTPMSKRLVLARWS